MSEDEKDLGVCLVDIGGGTSDIAVFTQGAIRHTAVIPIAGAFLLVQGIVEIIRCVICLKQGDWPSRVADVQEVDVDKLKEMVHVKDEDIAKLDRFVVAQEDAHK